MDVEKHIVSLREIGGPLNTSFYEIARVTQEAADALAAQAKEIAALREALREVADPISVMRERAEASGGQLDGWMAVYIANSASHLSGIAAAALEARHG